LNVFVTDPKLVNTVSNRKVSTPTRNLASLLLMNPSFLQEYSSADNRPVSNNLKKIFFIGTKLQ
jgi:hypothetical protein